MPKSDDEIKRHAARWMGRKVNQKTFISKYLSTEKVPRSEHLLVIFMAGSPGAGKTEFVKELKELDKKRQLTSKESFGVIDPDALRDCLPGYTGDNSHLFQNAISIGVGVLFRSALKNSQNIIVDGTFSNHKHVMKM